MKTEQIKNKETGEVLTTKDGEELVKHTLEVGDKFISLWNNPVSEMRGESKYARLYTKAKVQTSDGSEHEVYLDLTPTQFDTLVRVAKDKEEDDLNQLVFKTYEYDNSKGSVSVGITHKEKKPPVDF